MTSSRVLRAPAWQGFRRGRHPSRSCRCRGRRRYRRPGPSSRRGSRRRPRPAAPPDPLGQQPVVVGAAVEDDALLLAREVVVARSAPQRAPSLEPINVSAPVPPSTTSSWPVLLSSSSSPPSPKMRSAPLPACTLSCTRPGADQVVAATCGDPVVAASGPDHVTTIRPGQLVATGCADDGRPLALAARRRQLRRHRGSRPARTRKGRRSARQGPQRAWKFFTVTRYPTGAIRLQELS